MNPLRIGLHAIESHEDNDAPFDFNVGIALEPALEFALQRDALRIHDAMECLDFSRSDFRVDVEGRAWFLEINPLPSFCTRWYVRDARRTCWAAVRCVSG